MVPDAAAQKQLERTETHEQPLPNNSDVHAEAGRS